MNMYHPEQQNVGYTVSIDMPVASHKGVHELLFESRTTCKYICCLKKLGRIVTI